MVYNMVVSGDYIGDPLKMVSKSALSHHGCVAIHTQHDGDIPLHRDYVADQYVSDVIRWETGCDVNAFLFLSLYFFTLFYIFSFEITTVENAAKIGALCGWIALLWFVVAAVIVICRRKIYLVDIIFRDGKKSTVRCSPSMFLSISVNTNAKMWFNQGQEEDDEDFE